MLTLLRTRATLRATPLTEEPDLRWCWTALQRNLPRAQVAVLLPDEMALVVAERPGPALERLRRVQGHLARRLGAGSVWAPPEACPVSPSDLDALVLDLLLRPVVRRLVDDPVCWPWSTLRDAMGATCDPWVTADALDGQGVRAHVHLGETDEASDRTLPLGIEALLPDVSLLDLARAAAAATRTPVEAVTRPGRSRALFVGLARHHGWRSAAALGRATGLSPSGLRAIEARLHEDDLRPALRCLSDRRLLAPTPPLRPATGRPAGAQSWAQRSSVTGVRARPA